MPVIKGEKEKVAYMMDRSLVKMLEGYKLHSSEKTSVGVLIENAVRSYYDDPFKWEDLTAYSFYFPKNTDEWEDIEYED